MNARAQLIREAGGETDDVSPLARVYWHGVCFLNEGRGHFW